MIIIRYTLPHINSKYVYWCHFAFLSLEVFRYSFSYRYFSIALKVILHEWRIPHRLFKGPPLKVLLGFIIRMQFTCLVRSRSRWFSGYLIWLSRKARQRRKRKGKERIIIFCLPITPCSCSFPSLLLGPGLRYWRQTVSLLHAMWPRRNQWERTPVRKKISSKHFKLFKGDCTVNIKYNRTIIKLW